MYMKIFLVGDVLDIIIIGIVPNFKVKFSGVTISQGVEFSIFTLAALAMCRC